MHHEVTEEAEMLPLQGIRILEVSRLVAGAYCSMILADLGAEVIKVEQPGVGDDTRQLGPPFINGESAYFFSLNRNKMSLTLDLKKEKAKEIFRELAKQSDVVIENFRPGIMEKLGLGYQDLQKIRPDLIYCSITGFGRSGPYKDRPATDPILQATGGLMELIGNPGEKPLRIALPIIDMTSGLYAHGSILAALIARAKDKKSHFIEISLLNTVLSLLLYMGSNYLMAGQVPKRQGNAHPNIVPYNIFSTKDQDVFLSVSSDARWKTLCKFCELEDLIDDPRFSTNAARIQNRAEVEKILQKKLGEKTADEWMKTMEKTGGGVPFAVINSMDRVFKDPHVIASGILTEITHPVTGPIKMVGMPVLYDFSREQIRLPPPRLGEHNHKILKRFLRYSDQDLESLKKDGVI